MWKILKEIEYYFRETSYCGWVDINTILNDEGMNFLEFTIRFGRPTLEEFMASYTCDLGNLFYTMLTHKDIDEKPTEGKIVTSVCTFTYGYPWVDYSDMEMETTLHGICEANKICNVQQFWSTAGKNRDTLLCTWNERSAVFNGVGDTVEEGIEQVYKALKHIFGFTQVYRFDIGEGCQEKIEFLKENNIC